MFPNIEAELARFSLTRDEAAAFLGVSRRTFTSWMKGRGEIPASALVKMAEKWNCSVDYLLGRTINRAS